MCVGCCAVLIGESADCYSPILCKRDRRLFASITTKGMVQTRARAAAAEQSAAASASRARASSLKTSIAKSSGKKRAAADGESSVVICKRLFAGTINLHKKFAMRPNPSGSSRPFTVEKEYFESGIVQSQEELEAIAGKVRTHGYSRVKGPAGRVAIKVPLVQAANAASIDFENDVLCFAVFNDRRRSGRIESVTRSAAGSLLVACSSAGRDWSSIDAGSSQRWVSFAAAVVAKTQPVVAAFVGEDVRGSR